MLDKPNKYLLNTRPSEIYHVHDAPRSVRCSTSFVLATGRENVCQRGLIISTKSAIFYSPKETDDLTTEDAAWTSGRHATHFPANIKAGRSTFLIVKSTSSRSGDDGMDPNKIGCVCNHRPMLRHQRSAGAGPQQNHTEKESLTGRGCVLFLRFAGC